MPVLHRRRFLSRCAGVAAAGWTAGSDHQARGRATRSGADLDPKFSLEVARAITNARQAHRRFPGMVAAIVRGDRLLGIAAEGVRKVGAPEPIEVGDKFHLGSCTKAMTATLLASVVDSGKLGWDSTLAAVFPDQAGAMHADYRGVTLDQLLHHRAGLPANVAWLRFELIGSSTPGRRAVLAATLREAPESAPGSKFVYSNVGYVLAALMAEQVTMTSWEVMIRQVVFEPLGMTSAGFGPPGAADRVDQPRGHLSIGPAFIPNRLDNPAVLGPAGTVHMAVGDWAKFASFHLGDGSWNGRRIVTPESLAKLHTPATEQKYAGGWLVSPHTALTDGPAWDHGGSNTVWFAYILLAPRHHFGALVACNGGGDSAAAASISVVNALMALEPTTRA